MSNTSHRYIAIGACFAGLSVIAGAFGAHALKEILSNTSLNTYHTAVDYMFIHAIGLICLGILNQQSPAPCHKNILIAFILGIGLFSGSLFALSLTGIKWLGIITPFGGLCFIIGWSIFALCYIKKPHSTTMD